MKNSKYKALEAIYQLYENAIKDIDVKCEKQCASCCTCNVVMTSLEAGYLLDCLEPDDKKNLKTRLKHHALPKKYRPAMTTNTFARWCVEGKEVPEEENDPTWGNCPVLENDLCTLYEPRPFGCRALLSQTDCKTTGYAQIQPIVLTINNIFMQVIEHIDQNGISGNFSDMMTLFLSGKEKVLKDLPGMVKRDKHTRFILNEKIPVLMIPPEHRKALAPLLEKLEAIRTEDL